MFIAPLLSSCMVVVLPGRIVTTRIPRVKSIRIPEDRVYGSDPFPLTLTPTSSPTSLLALAEQHRDTLLALVAQNDAVLLRGFDAAACAMDFSRFVTTLELGDFEMGCSAAPRTNQAPGVFTANEAPPSEPIPFHHEMAQCDEKPSYVLFFCEFPAVEDGATPIIPSSAVASYLREAHPAVAEKFARLGVRYARTLPLEDDPSSPIGKSWRTAFSCSTQQEAEAAMREMGTSWEWLPSGDVRTVTKRMPVLRKHAVTEQEMFFNAVVAASTGWVDARNDPKKAVLFGDGSELDDAALSALQDVHRWMEEARVAFEWQAGDVLILDNFKAMREQPKIDPPPPPPPPPDLARSGRQSTGQVPEMVRRSVSRCGRLAPNLRGASAHPCVALGRADRWLGPRRAVCRRGARYGGRGARAAADDAVGEGAQHAATERGARAGAPAPALSAPPWRRRWPRADANKRVTHAEQRREDASRRARRVEGSEGGVCGDGGLGDPQWLPPPRLRVRLW